MATQGSFRCADCNRSFKRKFCWTRHVNHAHRTERPFQCNICGERSKRRDDLNRHLENQHGVKKVTCRNCYARIRSDGLADHQSTQMCRRNGQLRRTFESGTAPTSQNPIISSVNASSISNSLHSHAVIPSYRAESTSYVRAPPDTELPDRGSASSPGDSAVDHLWDTRSPSGASQVVSAAGLSAIPDCVDVLSDPFSDCYAFDSNPVDNHHAFEEGFDAAGNLWTGDSVAARFLDDGWNDTLASSLNTTNLLNNQHSMHDVEEPDLSYMNQPSTKSDNYIDPARLSSQESFGLASGPHTFDSVPYIGFNTAQRYSTPSNEDTAMSSTWLPQDPDQAWMTDMDKRRQPCHSPNVAPQSHGPQRESYTDRSSANEKAPLAELALYTVHGSEYEDSDMLSLSWSVQPAYDNGAPPIRARNDRTSDTVSGTSQSSFDGLHPATKRRDFFTIGRVFAAPWSEPENDENACTYTYSQRSNVKTRTRRFVVIREFDYPNQGFMVLPIVTYRKRDSEQSDVRDSDHAVRFIRPTSVERGRDGYAPGRQTFYPQISSERPVTGSLDPHSRLDYTDLYEFYWPGADVEDHLPHVPRRLLLTELGLNSYTTSPIVVDHGQGLRGHGISDEDHAMAYASWATSTSDNTSACWLQLIPDYSWSFSLYLFAVLGRILSWLVIAAALCLNIPRAGQVTSIITRRYVNDSGLRSTVSISMSATAIFCSDELIALRRSEQSASLTSA